MLSGSGLVNTAEDAAAAAEAIGYPVLLKATGGGGGRGIFLCYNQQEVLEQFHVSQKQGEQFFGNSGVSEGPLFHLLECNVTQSAPRLQYPCCCAAHLLDAQHLIKPAKPFIITSVSV